MFCYQEGDKGSCTTGGKYLGTIFKKGTYMFNLKLILDQLAVIWKTWLANFSISLQFSFSILRYSCELSESDRT